jgi:hypothetical protein
MASTLVRQVTGSSVAKKNRDIQTMTKFKLAAALLIVSASSAFADDYSLTSSVTVTADSATVWQAVGDFCDLDDWHPGIVSCVLEARDGAVHRQLTLGDGAPVLEQLVSEVAGQSYTYKIVEAPLPITDYVSTLSVTLGNPTTVTWAGTFKSDVPEMEGAIQGLYDGGLGAISTRFSE